MDRSRKGKRCFTRKSPQDLGTGGMKARRNPRKAKNSKKDKKKLVYINKAYK